jgi:hypothetical protein
VIQFPEDKKTIQLKHGHHTLPHVHEKTSFIYDGKNYCWEGHSELYENDCDQTILVARFQESINSDDTKLGQLEIFHDSISLRDLAVVTAMIVQGRSDEAKQAVSLNVGLKNAEFIRNNWQFRGKAVLIHLKGIRVRRVVVKYYDPFWSPWRKLKENKRTKARILRNSMTGQFIYRFQRINSKLILCRMHGFAKNVLSGTLSSQTY